MDAPTKSTIETSRKVYAMKYGLKFVAGITGAYIVGAYFVPTLEGIVFITAIGAAGSIISTLNLADGLKKGE